MKVTEIHTEVTPSQSDLGDQVQALLVKLARRCPRQFRVEWAGSKVPRGAQILGHTIAWTQHGLVVTDQNLELGVYERVTEWGGPNKDQHIMLVGVYEKFCSQERSV